MCICCNNTYLLYLYLPFTFVVRASDKRIARDEDLSDSEDEGDGRKNVSSSKEDGPPKKRVKSVTPVPKGTIEEKPDKKNDEKLSENEAEKIPEIDNKDNVAEKSASVDEIKQAPRFVILYIL